MVPSLAIIIPAYKPDFLGETLESLAKQTCQDFAVYIGDDNSPYELKKIIDPFSSRLKIIYKKFESNLGGHDLVSQWNRTLDLAAGYEWIWFFSDDDLISNDCVEKFYAHKKLYPRAELFHFNVKVIDENNNVIREPKAFPTNLKVNDYNLLRWKSQIFSYVVEFVFSAELFKKKGGFESFPFAWHTDEATWTKLGYPSGIFTISGSFVLWRKSQVNITPNNFDKKIVTGKLIADLDFSSWVINFYKRNTLHFSFAHKYYLSKRFVYHLAVSQNVLNENDWKNYLKSQLKRIGLSQFYLMFSIYYFIQYRRWNKKIQYL